MQPITEYLNIQQAFDFFNNALFDNRLPSVQITMQRRANSRGYFLSNGMKERGNERFVSEIALNPDAFVGRTDTQIFSTLAHEMVHLSQFIDGTSPRSGYHNMAWGDEMEKIGLCPSATGEPGGKKTGQKMSHYILDGGPFAVAMQSLTERGVRLTLESKHGKEEKKRTEKNKAVFICPVCQAKAWGKPSLRISCMDCNMTMKAAE